MMASNTNSFSRIRAAILAKKDDEKEASSSSSASPIFRNGTGTQVYTPGNTPSVLSVPSTRSPAQRICVDDMATAAPAITLRSDVQQSEEQNMEQEEPRLWWDSQGQQSFTDMVAEQAAQRAQQGLPFLSQQEPEEAADADTTDQEPPDNWTDEVLDKELAIENETGYTEGAQSNGTLQGFIQNQFDINPESAAIIERAFSLATDYYNTTGWLDDLRRAANTPGLEEWVEDTPPEMDVQTNTITRNLAALCVEYGGDFKWGMTAGLPTTEDAIQYFLECGMTTQEVKDMLLAVNMQRRSVDDKEFEQEYETMQNLGEMFGFSVTMYDINQYANLDLDGKNDFAHMIVASAAISGQEAPGHNLLNLILGFSRKAGGNSELSFLSNMKGDVYSAGKDPVEVALPEADYNANLDAVNICNRVNQGGISYYEAMIEYYNDLESGQTSREREFIENYGSGTMEQNFKRFKRDINRDKNLGVGIVSTGYSADKDEIEKAKNMVFDRIESILYE